LASEAKGRTFDSSQARHSSMTPTDSHPPAPLDPGIDAPAELARAAALLAAMDQGRDPSADAVAGVHDVDSGLAFQSQINRLRLARGERPVGFKIGFTNRTLWSRYGVFAPIWAPVWDTTLVAVDGAEAGENGSVSFDAGAISSRLNRPRIEPEIVLGLRSIPEHADPASVADAIEWVAHGFELVQSPWPDWQFHAGQAIASQSLHGALLVGPRRRVRESSALSAALAALEIDLALDGRQVAHGQGRDVLDGPVQALTHWLAAVRSSAADQAVRPAAGMAVTTGTLTDAQPIAPGTRWRSRLIDRDGALARCLEAPLADLDVTFGGSPVGDR
jgi:2-keto-4-pentenoate hydratase